MSSTSASSSKNNDDVNDVGGILLSLPQCDMERPDSDNKNNKMNVGETNKKSMKTTTKKIDLVLFQLPSSSTGTVNDLWEGRCQIYANNSSACLVTPSTSLQLVTVGSSNAMVLWEKGNDQNNNNKKKKNRNDEEGEESPMKRLKKSAERQDNGNDNTTTTTTTTTSNNITNCRLVQPGGSGSSFLVGQSNELDPNELSRFFTTVEKNSTRKTSAASTTISTSELCNLFQVAPGQIRYAMLYVPTVVSYYNNENKDEHEDDEGMIEYWQLVPEEEVLFGQQALVETLCEEDDDHDNEMTIEAMTTKVSQRLLPLLMDMKTNGTKGNNDDNNSSINNNKEKRSLAIARKTLLLASSSLLEHTKKNRKYKPNTSKIAFYVLRDLFMKYPSYAWSDLVDKWSTRLPIGEQYERITSTTEWIEDTKVCGLIPNQLTFSPSSSSSDNNIDETDTNNNNNNNNNSSSSSNSGKGVIRLVNPHSVLIWMGDDKKNK
jgi:hypothetical protein